MRNSMGIEKVFLDTSVIIGKVLGISKEADNIFNDGYIELYTNECVIKELYRVLKKQYHFSEAQIGYAIDFVRETCTVLPMPSKNEIKSIKIRDRSDRPIVLSAKKYALTLLIDDDDLIRDALGIVFKNKGCFIRTAESAEEGLQAIEEEKFDLILNDIKLPGMDGLEVLRLASNLQPDAINVLITAYRDKITASWKVATGCVDCIEKPFSVDGLARLLAQLITDQPDRFKIFEGH